MQLKSKMSMLAAMIVMSGLAMADEPAKPEAAPAAPAAHASPGDA